MSKYNELLALEIFDGRADYLDFPTAEEISLSYERARIVCQASGITVEDVVKLKPRFWEFYRHPIVGRDSSMGTTLSIHWNLCIGTIGSYVTHRPDLIPLLDKLINFDLCGEFLLTEIGRGLDARNLETTATLQPDGSFKLHTPSRSAAKAMPPTSPLAGVGRIGVVFARLIVNGADNGIKPFIVHLSNENGLLPGVTSQLLPKRCGAKALDHAITTFTNVHLGPESLLGSPDRARDQRADFFRQIHRVPVGTLSLSMCNIPCLRTSALIAGTYSSRRHVTGGSDSKGIPIIQFPTQYRPILDAVVQSWAYDAFADAAIALFLDKSLAMEIRHGVAVCFKTAVGTDTQATINELADRCGWQGLFAYNEIIELGMALRGNAIAEGDYTVLCIRLVSEVLLGRYELPEAKMKMSLLAKYEAGIWQEAREMIESLGSQDHRSEEINAHLLPRCRDMVKATGHRMAYEAAATSGKLKPAALRLFESTCMKKDLSWYCQFEGLSRNDFLAKDAEAAKEALPLLQDFLSHQSGHYETVVAPIMDENSWDEFVCNLPTFKGTTIVDSTSSYRL
ncbi:acyl-CoA dehydrogenase/oxidase [Xylaria flabelliformis]|nr:acyl-CoA dehydrogenase/oxidase [Xylaria flabelliformis]